MQSGRGAFGAFDRMMTHLRQAWCPADDRTFSRWLLDQSFNEEFVDPDQFICALHNVACCGNPISGQPHEFHPSLCIDAGTGHCRNRIDARRTAGPIRWPNRGA
jgi:hypothetical protein